MTILPLSSVLGAIFGSYCVPTSLMIAASVCAMAMWTRGAAIPSFWHIALWSPAPPSPWHASSPSLHSLYCCLRWQLWPAHFLASTGAPPERLSTNQFLLAPCDLVAHLLVCISCRFHRSNLTCDLTHDRAKRPVAPQVPQRQVPVADRGRIQGRIQRAARPATAAAMQDLAGYVRLHWDTVYVKCNSTTVKQCVPYVVPPNPVAMDCARGSHLK